MGAIMTGLRVAEMATRTARNSNGQQQQAPSQPGQTAEAGAATTGHHRGDGPQRRQGLRRVDPVRHR